MDKLKAGTVLNGRFELVEQLGGAEESAVYVVSDVETRERLFLWQSAQRFELAGRPPGAQDYFVQGETHYLVLRPGYRHAPDAGRHSAL